MHSTYSKAKKIIALCCLLYFTSYITRLNYAAALSEIIRSMGITKSMASLAVTGSFFTYALGQLISGPLGDHMPPEKCIFAGITATSVTNLIIATTDNITIMTFLWCLNGFFQAMLWPPLVRIMAENLSEKDFHIASIRVNAAAAVGTIAVYILVPICIRLGGWRLAFIIPGFFGLAIGGIWHHFSRLLIHGKIIEKQTIKNTTNQPVRLIFISGSIPILWAIMLQGTLKDGLTTWMPSYINDIYHLGTAVSILTTAILPLFSIFSISLASTLNDHIKDELITSVILFIPAIISISILRIFFSDNAVLSIALMTIITGCMHGINLLLVCRLPAYFEKYGCVSTVSGIFNTFTYIGSALATFGIAAISENFGWHITILSWGLIALTGLICCILSRKKWYAFSR